MNVLGFDAGLVSGSDDLVRFYLSVFDLTELEERRFPEGVVRRLQCGPAVLKIMIPAAAPAERPVPPHFWDEAGFRYISLWVDDLEEVVQRCEAAGGVVVMKPTQTRPGVRVLLLRDPDNNTVEVMHDAGQ